MNSNQNELKVSNTKSDFFFLSKRYVYLPFSFKKKVILQ